MTSQHISDQLISDQLLSRLSQLECTALTVRSNVSKADQSVYYKRVECEILRRRILGTAIFRVPLDYYDLPLSQRAELLESPVGSLCKTIIFENFAVESHPYLQPEEWTRNRVNLSHSRYVAVVVPYVHKIDVEALAKFVRVSSESGRAATALPTVKLVQADRGDILSEFPFNGITVFGMAISMPIILCKTLLESGFRFTWLGGGEVDLKLRIPTRQLADVSFICDCSVARECDTRDE